MIGILGGTGPQGRGLALRLAAAGHDVLIGSRSTDKARAVVAGLAWPGDAVSRIDGAANTDVARRAATVLLTVPYGGLADTLHPLAEHLAGTVVVSCVNALAFDRHGPRPALVDAGSAAEEAATLMPDARIVCAFNSVSAGHLEDPAATLDEDVLVCGDDDDAVAAVVGLADSISGLRGVAVGALRLAGAVEGLTAVLISANQRHKTTAGVRLTAL